MRYLQGNTELVDKNIILRKISELDMYQMQIEEFALTTLQEYTSDWKVQRIIERTLQMMIETCADIAHHIISDKAMRSPMSYADTFKVLHENHIIDAELFPAMDNMAKFRNIVVHRYENVDAEIILIILKKHLGDFVLFRNSILKYLSNQSD